MKNSAGQMLFTKWIERQKKSGFPFGITASKDSNIENELRAFGLTPTKEIKEAVETLLPFESQMMEWIKRSDQNKERFLTAPRSAFIAATNSETTVQQVKELLRDIHLPPLPSPATGITAKSAQSYSGNTDYTQGWDIVSAAYQKEINEGIRKVLEKSEKLRNWRIIKDNFELDAEIASIELVGGTGSIVTIAIAMDHGSCTIKDKSIWDMSGLAIEVQLELTPIESHIEEDTNAKKFDFTICFGEGAINKTEVTSYPESWSYLVRTIFSDLLDYAVEAIESQELIIFSVDITEKIEALTDAIPYLVPTFVKYAYIENTAGDTNDNVMGILVQTDGTPGMVQLHVDTIPKSSRGAFIFSNRIFLGNLLLDALCIGLGKEKHWFSYEENSLSVTTTDGFTYNLAIPNLPDFLITKMKLSINDDEQIELLAEFRDDNILLDFGGTLSTKLILEIEDDDNGQIIKVVELTAEQEIDIHGSFSWLINLIMALITGFLPPLGILLGFIVAGLVIALNVITLSTDGINALLSNKQITWKHVDVIRFTEIHPMDCLQIGFDVTTSQ